MGGCVINENSPDFRCDPCDYSWQKPRPASVPSQFRFFSGGFGGRNTVVTLVADSLYYETDEHAYPSSEPAVVSPSVTPSKEEWEDFWQLLKDVGFWKWESAYYDPHILDGHQWEISVGRGRRRKKVHGSNQYPAPRENFDRLLWGIDSILFKGELEVIE